jgi:hypothetical protein
MWYKHIPLANTHYTNICLICKVHWREFSVLVNRTTVRVFGVHIPNWSTTQILNDCGCSQI